MPTDDLLEDYILCHTDPETDALHYIDRQTHQTTIQPRMLSGHLQGNLLRMIVSLVNPCLVLEIGTFTAYSTIAMASGLTRPDAKLHTVEIDDEREDVIRRNVELAGMTDRIVVHIGDVIDVIEHIDGMFDLIFVDGDKREYLSYYNALLPRLRSGGLMIADNVLWDGHVLHTAKHNDRHTRALQEFNDAVAADIRVEKLILPMRDGLMLIRKK